MLKSSIFIFFYAFLLFGCSNSDSTEIQSNLEIEKNNACHLLIFKNEQKAELWTTADKNSFLDSFKITDLPELPIGEFDATFDNKNNKIEIHFPNEFYKSKSYKIELFENLDLGIENFSTQFFTKLENIQISKIIIFPNDNRLGGELKPCFACPHWMAEVYTFLNLKKKEYL